MAFCGFPCALLRVAAKRRGSVAAGGLRPQLAGDRWWGGPAVNSGRLILSRPPHPQGAENGAPRFPPRARLVTAFRRAAAI